MKGLGVLYWVNPSQLFLAGDRTNAFKLTNSRSVCVRDCPRLGANNTIAWVCDYPEGVNVTMAQWVKRSYNYFSLLSPEQQAASKKFAGPCYPVLFPNTNGM